MIPSRRPSSIIWQVQFYFTNGSSKFPSCFTFVSSRGEARSESNGQYEALSAFEGRIDRCLFFNIQTYTAITWAPLVLLNTTISDRLHLLQNRTVCTLPISDPSSTRLQSKSHYIRLQFSSDQPQLADSVPTSST